MTINKVHCLANRVLSSSFKIALLFLSIQSFAQRDVKFTTLPAVGSYDDNGKRLINVTGDSGAVNVEVFSYSEDRYYSKIGSCLTDRSKFEDLNYTIKFKFIKGGGKSSIGVQFELKFKGGVAERYVYCIISKNENIVIGRYDSKPLKCKLNKTETNTLQVIKTGNDWKYIVNGVTISETQDQEALLVNGKGTGQLIFGLNQIVAIENITQEFKNGTLGYDNVPVKIVPRDLAYYQGDYTMSTSCGVFKDFNLNIRTYRTGEYMYAEINGISPEISQIRLDEKTPQVYSASHGTTFIPSLKEYGTQISINNERYFFKDFTLEAGVIMFKLYYEQDNGVDYTNGKTVSKYKVLDCFFKNK
ncbi:MAG: hypothetical protein ABIN01_06295 [Ferruginibacter sp.]